MSGGERNLDSFHALDDRLAALERKLDRFDAAHDLERSDAMIEMRRRQRDLRQRVKDAIADGSVWAEIGAEFERDFQAVSLEAARAMGACDA